MSLLCLYRPIVQPLAPYPTAGCCAVTGAVPHALFMVISVYHIIMICQFENTIGSVNVALNLFFQIGEIFTLFFRKLFAAVKLLNILIQLVR